MAIKRCSNHEHEPLPRYPLCIHQRPTINPDTKEYVPEYSWPRPGRLVKDQAGDRVYRMTTAGSLVRVE